MNPYFNNVSQPIKDIRRID